MQLGLIGTGEITSSIVTGLSSFGAAPYTIQLSPRNASIAKELAARFKGQPLLHATNKFSTFPILWSLP